MDIDKVISDSIDKYATSVLEGDYNCLNDYPQLSQQAKIDTMLMKYSEILIETYHQELKNLLEKQGIHL